MTVWQITGTAFDGADARVVSVQAFTTSPSKPPDPGRALDVARPGWTWISVGTPAVIVVLPRAWDALDDFAAGLLALAVAYEDRRLSEALTRTDELPVGQPAAPA